MKYDLAEASFRRALAASGTRSDSRRDLAQFLYELGFLLYYVGRYPEAEPYLLQALPLYETLYGANDPETVRVFERIALNYEHCPKCRCGSTLLEKEADQMATAQTEP